MKQVLIMTFTASVFLAAGFTGILRAQDNGTGSPAATTRDESTAPDSILHRIITVKGNRYIGRLVSESETGIVLQTDELGRVTIRREDIKKNDAFPSSRIVGGRYWYRNPNATRYFFSTNARPIGTGRGYYQNTWVLFNNLNVGLTPNISLGGGVVPLFLMGVSETPAWVLPKISIPIGSDRFYLAAGAMLGGILGVENSGLGLVYGVATYGTDDSNMTLGIGYGYAGDSWSDTPVVNFSFMQRTNRSLYLISENYLITTGDTRTLLLSGGIRWAPEHFAVDFGLIFPTGQGEMYAIPWLGVTLPF